MNLPWTVPQKCPNTIMPKKKRKRVWTNASSDQAQGVKRAKNVYVNAGTDGPKQKKKKKKKKKKKQKGVSRDKSLTPAHKHSQPSPPQKKSKPPKPYIAYDKVSKYFLPSHREFRKCLETSYRGFTRISKAELPAKLHDSVINALEMLRREGIYHHDVVSAGKNAISGTMCRRTLLGDPGMTYHYQKLRLFALPWNGRQTKLDKAYNKISKLGKALDRKASEYKSTSGSSNYNVCLINYMAPDGKYPLRNETKFGIGKMSVSWHADSSLQQYSTIGVYHVTGSNTSNWAIASRVTNDDKTPALVVPLKNKDTYFMLDDFNHHHQHAVITGSSWRYSCTMRVAVTKQDTWDYILAKALEGNDFANSLMKKLSRSRDDPKSLSNAMDPQILRKLGAANMEIEFEWLRMFFLQGKEHMKSHRQYWLPRIEKLEELWSNIDRSIYLSIHFLSENKPRLKPKRRTLDILLWLLKERKSLRDEYGRRIRHSAYKVLDSQWQPMSKRPCYFAKANDPSFVLQDAIVVVDYYLKNKVFT